MVVQPIFFAFPSAICYGYHSGQLKEVMYVFVLSCPCCGTSNLKNVQIRCIFQVMSKEVTAYLTTMSRTNSYHKTKRPPHRVSWFCFVFLGNYTVFIGNIVSQQLSWPKKTMQQLKGLPNPGATCFMITLKEIKLSFFFVLKYLYPLKKILSHLQKNTWYSCSTLTTQGT